MGHWNSTPICSIDLGSSHLRISSVLVVSLFILKRLLDGKEIKPVNPKENRSWMFIRRTGAEAEASVLWPPDGKSWLIRKDPDAGKDWCRRRRGWQKTRWLDGMTDLVDMSLSKLWVMLKDREAWHAAVHEVTKSVTWLSDWTATMRRVEGSVVAHSRGNE